MGFCFKWLKSDSESSKYLDLGTGETRGRETRGRGDKARGDFMTFKKNIHFKQDKEGNP